VLIQTFCVGSDILDKVTRGGRVQQFADLRSNLPAWQWSFCSSFVRNVMLEVIAIPLIFGFEFGMGLEVILASLVTTKLKYNAIPWQQAQHISYHIERLLLEMQLLNLAPVFKKIPVILEKILFNK